MRNPKSEVPNLKSVKSQIRNPKSQIVFLCLLILFGCGNKSKIENSKFKITDDVGVEVSFDSIPKRVISLAPNITEALYAIGADSLLVGITSFCDYPPETKSKTKTGSYLSPDFETIASLSPDLILINVESTSQPTYVTLKNLGFKLYVSNAKTISNIVTMIKNFGTITGKKTNAGTVALTITEAIKHFQSSKIDSSMNKTFIVISVNPVMTANKNTFISEIVELAGFTNIYSNATIDYPLISYEDITEKNPSSIILPTDTANISQYSKYTNELQEKLNTTDAIKNNKIILIDDDIMFRPGPRVITAVRLLERHRRAVE